MYLSTFITPNQPTNTFTHKHYLVTEKQVTLELK